MFGFAAFFLLHLMTQSHQPFITKRQFIQNDSHMWWAQSDRNAFPNMKKKMRFFSTNFSSRGVDDDDGDRVHVPFSTPFINAVRRRDVECAVAVDA